MDAIKFLNEYKRMCNTLKCVNCPACTPDCDCILSVDSNTHPEEKIKIIENWSNEHPVKTRQSVFLDQYPNASVIEGCGTIGICPRELDKDYECFYQHPDGTDVKIVDCLECKKQFWMQEVE